MRWLTSLADQHGPNGCEAATQSPGDRHQIRRNCFLFAGMERPSATHTAHHLVQNQQHPVTIADLADGFEIAWHGRDGTERGAGDGFGDAGGNVLRAQLPNFGIELAGQALSVGRSCLVGAALAIG